MKFFAGERDFGTFEVICAKHVILGLLGHGIQRYITQRSKSEEHLEISSKFLLPTLLQNDL